MRHRIRELFLIIAIFSETVSASQNFHHGANNNTMVEIMLSKNENGVSGDESANGKLNLKNKLSVAKCCKLGEVVTINLRLNSKTCKKYSEKLNFSVVPLYDDNLSKTGRFLPQVLRWEGKFDNETFKSTSYSIPSFDEQLSAKFAGQYFNYYLTESAVLYREVPNALKRWHVYDKNNFCVDYLLKSKGPPRLRFWFVENFTSFQSRNYLQEYIYISGLLTSCVFLFLTLLVYFLLHELRNLGGLILMAYAFSLFNAFLLLALIKLNRFSITGCKGMTYTIYFFFLSSFAWMNIMSCDIWWTFRGYAKARPIHRRGEPFKFMIYCLYGFGVPLLMAIAMAVIDNLSLRHLPWIVIPNIGFDGCFLGEDSRLVYLYVPMFIMIICNWLFFLMTAFNIWRLHRSTKVLDTTASGAPAAHRTQKDRFLIYLKLSIIMGINWLLEMISSFQPEATVWYISDIYNILIGLSIFLIFVCKRKILEKLVKRFRGYSESVQGWRRSQYSNSRSSHTTTESEITPDTPLVCVSPKGPIYLSRSKDV